MKMVFFITWRIILDSRRVPPPYLDDVLSIKKKYIHLKSIRINFKLASNILIQIGLSFMIQSPLMIRSKIFME